MRSKFWRAPLLLLAIVNIRNAWDLTLTMVRHHAGKRRSN